MGATKELKPERKPHKCWVQASTPEEALSVASDLMVREECELRVLSSRGTSYSVGCLVSDVDLTFSVTPDKMLVCLQSVKEIEGARELSVGVVKRQLQISGVVAGLVEEGIESVVRLWVSKGVLDTSTAIAVGSAPVQSCDSSVELSSDVLDKAVFSGDLIGRVTGPVEANSGKNVFGEEFEPEEVEDSELKLGFGVESRGGELFATVYGEVRYTGVHLSVVPGFVLCERELRVTLDLFPFSLTGRAVTMAELRSVLRDSGVLDEYVDLDLIRQRLKIVWETGVPSRGLVVAKAVEPVQGTNGHVELSVGVAGNASLPVSPGTVVGQWHPRVDPSAGTNLFGVTIEAEALETTTNDEVRCGGGIILEGNNFVASGFGIARSFGSYVELSSVVSIAEDGLTAVIDVYPTDCNGIEVGKDLYLMALNSAGIVERFVDVGALESALSHAKKRESPLMGVTVATGEPPEEAWATEYLFREELRGVSVMAGEPLVEILEGAPSRPGTTVVGETIDIGVARAGEGSLDLSGACVVSEDGGYVLATEYGQVDFTPTSVTVEPALTIVNNGERAELDLYFDHHGGLLRLEDVLQILKFRGIVHHRINEQSIVEALEKIKAEGENQTGVVVADSVKPETGLPPSVHIEEPSVIVFPNERVAWISKGSGSVNGEDIFGKRLLADAYSVVEDIVTGPFVGLATLSAEAEPNILRAYQSTALGRMTVERVVQGVQEKTVLSVTPSLRFSGNKTSCWMELSATHLDGSSVEVREVEAVLLGMGFDQRVVCHASIQRVIDAGGGEALVAKSEDWQQPSDWRIEPAYKSDNEVLFSGDIIARVVSGTPAAEGYDLEGKSIPVGEYGAGLSLCAGPYTSMHEDGSSVLATVYGHAVIEGLKAKVLPGIWVSSDKMKMFVNVFPSRIGGVDYSAEDLIALIAEEGFSKAQLDEGAINSAFESSKKRGRPEWSVCAGNGVAPVAGVNGSLEAIGDHSQIAFPGDSLVRVVPEKEGKPGLNVYGEELPVPFIATPATVSPEGGCRIGDDGCVEAGEYGRVYLEGSRVIVQPAIHFSADRLSLSMDISKRKINGERVTQSDILGFLDEINIVDEFIDKGAISAALTSREEKSLAVVVAVGEEPVLGEDGDLRLAGDASKLVFIGDLVASFDPHTPPTLGRAVDGGPINPTSEPERVHLLPGDGVALSPDKLQSTAEVAGYVEVKGDSTRVIPAITFSDDKMECRMALTSERFGGGTVSVEDVVEELIKHGVLEVCIDKDAVVQALSESGGVVIEAVVARGAESRAGSDGKLEILESLEGGAIFKGDEIVRIEPHVVSQAGHDVLGEPISALEGVKRYVLEGDAGVELVDDDTIAVAQGYGGAEVSIAEPVVSDLEGVSHDIIVTVNFDPGVTISSNQLDCRMDLYPHSASGGEAGLSEIVSVLKEEGVLERFVLKRVLTGAIRMAARMLQRQVAILVAKGEPPRHGVDGRIKLLDSKQPSASNKRAFGRVDFKEVDTLVQVLAGDGVAEVTPPILGIPGETVTGDRIEAQNGAEVPLELGDGVNFKDGLVYANREGVVTAMGGKIDVVDLFTVDGDVDYHSGNVRVRSGCVRIKGSVFPGFRVSCPADVEVEGSVDGGARIEAGGHIVVRGAVVAGQKESTELNAGGNVTIGVGRNATITAGGDVMIQKEALHCEITTESKVIIERRPGVLSGGVIKAKGGVFTHQLGSAQWTPTTVHVGGESSKVVKLLEEHSKALHNRVVLNDKLGGLSDDELRASAKPEELPDVERLILRRDEVRRNCFKLDEKLKRERFRAEREPNPMIEVRENLFPRVVINFGRSQYKSEAQVSRKRIYLEPSSGEIEVDDLSSELPDFLRGPEIEEEG